MKNNLTQQKIYELALESFGVVPGIIKEAAERSLETAYLYTSGTATMENASFNNIEMNAIELKISVLNHCESCTKGHTYLLKQAGLPDEAIKAIIAGGDTGNIRLNQLLQAAEYIYHAGSDEFPEYVLEFLEEQVSEKEVADIIGLIALKTISNYINNYLVSVRKLKRERPV